MMSANRQGTTGKWDCSCGYPGTSRADLDEHLRAVSGLDPEGAHRPVND